MKLFIFISLLRVHLMASICTLNTLKNEIIQDILDNGQLDCLRNISIPSFGLMNGDMAMNEIKHNRIIEAQWDTDCSFELKDNRLLDLFGLSTYIDTKGKPYSNNSLD